MAERTYTDFDVTLRAVGAGYEAQVSSVAGTGSHRFTLPFSDRELADFYSIFGGAAVRRMESPQLERARAFGGRLFGAVFNDELDDLLASSLRQAGEAGNGLRIRLLLDDAPDLVNIPWEYLYRSASDDFFALSNWTPIVRFLNVEARMPPAPIEPPLRVLVMISDPIEYQGSLDVEREWERLQESLADLVEDGHVQLHRLERATERELLGELRRNDHHIFHFVGHGEFDDQEQDGVLLLEDEHRRTKLVTGRALGTVLRDSRSMRLAVLNNCEGARTSDSDPFAGAAQSLIQKGLPAVAAMQFEVTDRAAISFAHEFYAGLSDGYPVDAALAEARKAIFQGATRYEFGSPVLYLSADDGVIFDIGSRTEEADHDDAAAPTDSDPEPENPSDPDNDELVLPILAGISSPSPTLEMDPPEPVDPSQQGSIAGLSDSEPQPSVTESEALTQEMPRIDRRPESSPRKRNKRLYGYLGAAAAALILIIAVAVVGGGTEVADTTVVTEVPGTVTEVPRVEVTEVPSVEAVAADPPTVADFATAAPTIDGSDDEWASRFAYLSEFKVFGEDNIENDADLSARWRVAWDNAFLYVFAEVSDDEIVQVNTGSSLFKGDTIAFYFDGDLADDAPNAGINDDDFAFFLAPDSGENWVRLVPNSEGTFFGSADAVVSDADLEVATQLTAAGYNIEARVPWNLLGVSSPHPDQEFRMTLDVSDNDTPGTSDQQAMRSNSVGRTSAAQGFPEVWEMMTLESPAG
ncbi:MAG: CHAT domain-containing protein [Actinomycetota bacterium]|nr:CHAT domain-containing protein [Actinomycetota bacterium]